MSVSFVPCVSADAPTRLLNASALSRALVRSTRQVGGPVKSKFTQYSSLSSALFDDDTDLLDLDD